MKEYTYTRILAIVVGILTISLAVGYGFFALIAIGLSNVWSVDGSTSTTQYSSVLALFITIFMIGLFTIIGSLKLKSNTWAKIYIGFIILIAIGFIIAFITLSGAIGIKVESFILFIGALYLILGCMAYKKK